MARPFVTDPSLLVLRMANDSRDAMEGAISKLRALPQVKSAEPNQIVHVFDHTFDHTFDNGARDDKRDKNWDGYSGNNPELASGVSASVTTTMERSLARQREPVCSPVAIDVPIPNVRISLKPGLFKILGKRIPQAR